MSLFGMMRTGVSGMNAQANRLGTVADNIANADTTGYKRASTEFSTLLLPSSGGSYNSGGVTTTVRNAISSQGMLNFTTSATDLAITGAGFFIVQDGSGTPYLTRAGSFVPDQNGNLVNAAGYMLLGYPYSSGTPPATVANGLGGLVPITLNSSSLTPPVPSTQGTLTVNLPSATAPAGSAIVGQPPSQNAPNTAYNHKMSVVSASASGEIVYSDIYFTKLADNTWEITVFDNYSGAPSGVPYDLSSGDIMMGTTTLTFDPVTGAIVSGNPFVITDPNDPVYLDFSNLTQAAGGPGAAMSMKVNANLPSDDPILDTGAGELPASSNDPASVYNQMLKMTGYAGANIDLDFYFTKTGADTWEVAVYDASMTSGFPYGSPALATTTLTFDPATGNLVSGGSMTVPLPDGGSTWPVDLSGVVSLPDFTPGVDEGVYVAFNLSATAPTVQPHIDATTPASNQSDSAYTQKTSLVAYDNLGNQVLLDVFYTKGPDNKWEVTVYNQADADASASGFPYSTPPLASTLMEFDPSTGKVIDGGSISFTVPGGSDLTLDLSKTTQYGSGFAVQDAKLNGHAAGMAVGFEISEDGTVYAKYDNGDLEPIYRLAMADVASPDQLRPLSGNVFETTPDSGAVRTGFAGSGGFGTITSGALENSNVDIAEELTNMISAQRSYTANSKVFQTGSDLMDVLVNLKR